MPGTVYTSKELCKKRTNCKNECVESNTHTEDGANLYMCPSTPTSSTSTCANGQFQASTHFKDKVTCEKYYKKCTAVTPSGPPYSYCDDCTGIKEDGMCLDSNDEYTPPQGGAFLFRMRDKYLKK